MHVSAGPIALSIFGSGASRIAFAAGLVCAAILLPPNFLPADDTPGESLRRDQALVAAAEDARIARIAEVSPSVVAIFSANGDGGGSGVLISADGFALTNYHVVQGSGPFLKCGLNNGELYDAVVVGIDPTGDVALIKMLGRSDFPAATLGDSETVQVGDWVYVIGNPFLLAADYSPTVTYGIVSGIHRYQYPAGTFLEYGDCIQVDASINPGNSGGPLFASNGDLIGINGRGSFEKRGRVNVGAGYAISINQIKNFLDQLKGGRVVDHASLGATVRSGLTPVQSELEGGVFVDSILETSSAYRRGLRDGDEILSLGGRSISTVNQFKNVLAVFPKGWSLPLVYRRNGKRQEILVELRGVQRESVLLSEFGGGPKEKKPAMPGERPGQKPDNGKPDQGKPGGPQPAPQQPPGGEDDHAPNHDHSADEGPEDPVAPELAALFESKRGFANYHFNRLAQDRGRLALEPLRKSCEGTGRWKLAGKNAAGQSFVFTLTDNGLGLEFNGQPFVQQLDGSSLVDEPPGSGGLLVALHQFRQFVRLGESWLNEFTYYGSQPLDGGEEVVDVFIGSVGGVTTRWFISKKSAELVGFDTRIAPDMEPCEVRIEDWALFGKRLFPSRFRVVSSGVVFGVFELTGVDWGLPK